MAIDLLEGARPDQATQRSAALEDNPENPIPYSSGGLENESMVHEFPIHSIECAIEGTVSVGSGSALSEFGIWNLIQRLTLQVDNQPRVDLKGYQLPFITRLYAHHDAYADNPDLSTTGTKSFFAAFTIPLDVGGYMSLLDASRNGSLNLQIRWGQDSDITDGTGSVTIQSGTVLRVHPLVVTGIGADDNGNPQPGAKGFDYLKQTILTQTYPIKAAQSDFDIDLLNARGYHGLSMFFLSGGSLSDSILNSARIRRAGDVHLEYTSDEIRAMNHKRYRLGASEWTGVREFPFVKPNHPEHVLSIDSTQAMNLLLDVNNPGTDKVELVQHFFRLS